MKKLYLLLLFILLASFTNAQDIYERHSFIEGKDTLRYRLLLPKNYNPKVKYPLMISLHGSGHRGYDNEKQLLYTNDLFLDSLNREKYPCFCFLPQCPPPPIAWSFMDRFVQPVIFPPTATVPMKLTISTIHELIKNYPIDENRIYITGLSMGGCGTYDIVIRNPDMFAAAAPICGWIDTSKASVIKDVPIWIFHGDSDNVVSVNYSRNMVKALKNAGGNPRYTEYPNVNHASWVYAYKEPDFLEWMFSHKRKK